MLDLETRLERHQKKRQQKPERNKVSFKVIGGLTLVAVVCFAIGVGASHWSANHNADEEGQTAAVTETASSSPSPSLPGGQTSPSASPSAGPTPSAVANAPSSPQPSSSAGSASPAASAPQGSGQQVKLTFVGDVMMASKVEDILKQKGYDYPYTNVTDLLSKADYTIANLETPVTTRGTEQKKDYVYRSSPLALSALRASGIDLVNLANNHVMDYGTEGLLDTFDALDQEGIQRMGAGKNLEEAYQPVIVEKQGIKIAFLGFSRVVPEGSWKAAAGHPGVAETYNYKPAVEAIQKAKEKADIVVVTAHWGVERSDQPDKYQKELAHRYIDAGADLIVGGHPHVLQGFEQYKGKWIAYSLGNFIFTTNDVPKTWETVALEASCTKDKQCDVHLVPILTKMALPTPMSTEDGTKLFQRLSQISIGAHVDAYGRVTSK